MINLIFNKTVEIINCMNILKSNKSFQIVNINLFSKPEWYIKLNPPSGATPCIQLDDGRTIPESLICSEYLDKAYSGEKLTPTDAYTNSQHKLILEYFNTKVIFNFYNAIKGENESSVNDFIKCLEELESKLPDNERFFGGERPAFVDYMIWPWLERLEVLERIRGFRVAEKGHVPKLLAYIERMKILPAVMALRLKPELHEQFFKDSKAGIEPKYDSAIIY